MRRKYPKLPELWDIQDRRKVEQPDLTKAHVVPHSSNYAANDYELALRAMPPDAVERYLRALETVNNMIYWIQRAEGSRKSNTSALRE